MAASTTTSLHRPSRKAERTPRTASPRGNAPTAPYPADCATFNQFGFRVPFVAVSPFAKAHYVSHTLGSHTSLLAFLENRFSLPSLTTRDANASDLEDMFDFDGSPSASAAIGTAPLPMQPGDPNCPFGSAPTAEAFANHPAL